MAYKNKEDAKRWYADHREEEIAKAKERNKRYRDRNRKYIDDAKSVPCQDCGDSYPSYVMDFDHIGEDKEYLISTMVVRQCSLSKIQKEIDKCEVVCSNCHRVRTHLRKQMGLV